MFDLRRFRGCGCIIAGEYVLRKTFICFDIFAAVTATTTGAGTATMSSVSPLSFLDDFLTYLTSCFRRLWFFDGYLFSFSALSACNFCLVKL
jgi:hypothetical protein